MKRLDAKRAPGGFSLVELLLAIAIVGILVGIVVPFLMDARKKAGIAQCASNLRTLGGALIMYAQDQGGRLPGLNHPYWDVAALSMLDQSSYPAPYSDVLKCPADDYDRPDGYQPRSYSMNPVLMNYFDLFTSSGATSERNQGMRLNNLVNPSTIFLLMEHHRSENVYAGGNYIVSTGVKDVHSGGMNVVFCDGHVEFVANQSVEEFQKNYQVNHR
ncbi:MAG: prepilin-type N-terminal cleavage/methylation domain-containing protein [Puniceicoccales bacterium]